ncbi:hypothetical protein EVAR_46832_1 [Eumeta japonica]|uniref:Uncharacterized protein n=1 Tax=Eumeta variegata TaxID=151549 RepID=A0A4C2AAI7_EUMVA|nr:hypothetical protein EVAR_46832_1 [Eumeta japonica]
MDKPLTTNIQTVIAGQTAPTLELLADLAERSPVCTRPLHQNAIPRRHESELCIFPRSAVQQRRTRATYQLSAANGTTINTYGYVNLELNLSLRRAYPWRFVVANVTKPIIGADFLQFYNLMVDIRNRRLIDNTTTLSTSGSDAISSSTISSVKILNGDTRYDKLLAKFPDITQPSGTLRGPKHNTVHLIKNHPRPSCVLSTTSLGARQITDS